MFYSILHVFWEYQELGLKDESFSYQNQSLKECNVQIVKAAILIVFRMIQNSLFKKSFNWIIFA